MTGCIGEIIAFYKTLNDQETSYSVHEFLIQLFDTDAYWFSDNLSIF